MGRVSISFALIVSILGLLIGSVAGSLLQQVFGLEFLDRPLGGESFALITGFYLIELLELRLTPAALLGLAGAVWLLYRTGKQ